MTELVSGAQDRSIAALVRQELGFKNIKKFFPNPNNYLDPLGNVTTFEEFVNTALWWLGETIPVELTDTFELDVNGQLYLDRGPGQRVKRVMRVFQGGTPYEKFSMDWSEGWPSPRGHWQVRNSVFYTVGYGSGLSWYSPNSLLRTGQLDLTYWGIPKEEQIKGNTRFLRACVDYCLYLAFFSMIPKIVRPKNIKLEGIPQITDNSEDYVNLAKMYLEKAEQGARAGQISIMQR